MGLESLRGRRDRAKLKWSLNILCDLVKMY